MLDKDKVNSHVDGLINEVLSLQKQVDNLNQINDELREQKVEYLDRYIKLKQSADEMAQYRKDLQTPNVGLNDYDITKEE